jgi:hypothetical protein
LTHVISRLPGGYDYVIAHDQGTIDLVVWGKHGEAPAPVQATPNLIEKCSKVWPIAYDFVFPASHRRIAVSLLAGTLNSAASFMAY